MSNDKDIWSAIQARYLRAVSELIHTQVTDRTSAAICTCGKLLEPLAVFHDLGCDFRVAEATRQHEVQYTNCDICDVNEGHREMMWGGVICESCDEKLRREQR